MYNFIDVTAEINSDACEFYITRSVINQFTEPVSLVLPDFQAPFS